MTTRCRRARDQQWALDGAAGRSARKTPCLNAAPGKIVIRFQARDLHLVLGPGPDGKPVRFRVRLDGAVPGDDRGIDVGADGVRHRRRSIGSIN